VAEELEQQPCPKCGVGTLVRIDDQLLSCTDCGYDVAIQTEREEENDE
jgi:ribosomal protein L37AE/L43A